MVNPVGLIVAGAIVLALGDIRNAPGAAGSRQAPRIPKVHGSILGHASMTVDGHVGRPVDGDHEVGEVRLDPHDGRRRRRAYSRAVHGLNHVTISEPRR